MTPELLRDAGMALYTSGWIAPLAKALGYNRKTVQRWADGNYQIPPDLGPKLLAMLRARQLDIIDIIDDIENSDV